MKLEFVQEARKVFLLSWSSRFGALAAILQALAEFQDQLPGIREFVPHGVFSMLAIACAIAVPVSRIVKQQALIKVATPDPAPVESPAPVEPVAAPPAVVTVPAVSTDGAPDFQTAIAAHAERMASAARAKVYAQATQLVQTLTAPGVVPGATAPAPVAKAAPAAVPAVVPQTVGVVVQTAQPVVTPAGQVLNVPQNTVPPVVPVTP